MHLYIYQKSNAANPNKIWQSDQFLIKSASIWQKKNEKLDCFESVTNLVSEILHEVKVGGKSDFICLPIKRNNVTSLQIGIVGNQN